MPTIKEQIDLIQQNQEKNKQLEKELQDILYKQQDLISTGLKNNLSATNSIDGYTSLSNQNPTTCLHKNRNNDYGSKP